MTSSEASSISWPRVAEVFERVVDLSAEEREALLNEQDDALRAEVLRLLTADRRAGDFLDQTPPWPPLSPVAGSEKDDALPSGHILAQRYRIVHRIGRGGMGAVYRAEDLRLDQFVALKVLRAEDPELRKRLQHEVRIARRVTHPNVCRIYDLGEDEDGLLFLTMELVEGETLAQLLRRAGRLSPERARELARDICEGLSAAHVQGILHRDLKPANLLLDDEGHVRLSDFGLSALADTVRGVEARSGTPAYMAPEQHSGGELGVRTDVYAFGLILGEMVTGTRAGSSFLSLPERVAEIDRGLAEIVEQCLQEDPAERPASAQAVAANLREDATLSVVWIPMPGATPPGRPHWKIEERLGAGGFGEVWRVRHEKTGERRVFKFCAENTRRAALQREITLFRLLREELGEREDIVRIFDWSFDEPPYFLEAEYIPDGNLVQWAAQRGGIEQVPLVDRLEIVAQIADALAAAHSVGILHKDVKPGNVLMRPPTPGESGVRACLSDFGVGAVLERERLEAAGITVQGLSLSRGAEGAGTPLYLPPEVLEGRPATLQADIYALGVLLYQMVIGDFSRALAPGWQREIDDPLLLEDIAQAVDGSPARRLGNALRIAERLRSIDRRRAFSVAEERVLREGEEREAQLELERLRRKELRGVVAALCLFAVLLILTTWQVRDAAREAEREAELSRRTTHFLVDLFRLSHPEGGVRADAATMKLLEASSDRIAAEIDHPLLRARLEHAVGKIYLGLGAYAEAEGLLLAAQAQRDAAFGKRDHPERLESLLAVAELRNALGDPRAAQAGAREALKMARRLRPGTSAEAGRALREIGVALTALGSSDAGRTLNEALETQRRFFGDEHVELARTYHAFGHLRRMQGQVEQCREMFQRAAEILFRQVGGPHPELSGLEDDLRACSEEPPSQPPASSN